MQEMGPVIENHTVSTEKVHVMTVTTAKALV